MRVDNYRRVLILHVKSIKLINFRNYEGVKLELGKGLNLFLGNNAQGKTNLLEAIYISAIGRSYRTAVDKELICFQKERAYIGVEVHTVRGERFIEFKFERNSKKRVRVNKLEVERASELSGSLNVVIFAPEDLNLIKEGPSTRRAFLDTEISQIKPKYRYNLSRYNKILFQRNRLLKNGRNIQLDQLEPWDIQLASIGAYIVRERLDFLEKLSAISRDIHARVSGGREELSIAYQSSLPTEDVDNFEDNFYHALERNRLHDAEKRFTNLGPHRDDMEILINGVSCRNFGSQGQQRTAALSLKLAEVELIHGEIGEYPVLLLDDVLSELDLDRRRYLVSTFRDVQTIITSTDDIDLLEGEEKRIFYISDGKLSTESYT